MKKYIWLIAAFAAGTAVGAFTVNGLSPVQREELNYYFQGFLHLLGNQNINGSELMKLSLIRNLRLAAVLWLLGATIVGIPLIFVVIGINGFITGFTSGFVIQSAGMKGLLFTVLGLLPGKILMIPCIISLGVFGINFSLSIIKNRSKRSFSRESLKNDFMAYCLVTMMFCAIIFAGCLVEAYIAPVFIRMIAPVIAS